MAEPTTPIEKPAQPAHLSLQEMSVDQVRQWEKTGDMIPREPVAEKSKAEIDAEAAAAKPVDQAASRDAKPAVPDTATVETKKGPGQKKSAKERAGEVDADIAELNSRLKIRAELKRELDALDRKPKQDAKGEPSSPAKAAATDPAWKKYLTMPGAPKAKDFDGENALDEYAAAMGSFIAEQIADEKFGKLWDERTKASTQAADEDQAFGELVTHAVTRAEAEAEADPEILDRIDDRWKGLNPSNRLGDQRLSPAHFVKDRVMFHSNHPLKLSELLTKDNSKELARIARLSPDAIIREVAYLDASFGALSTETETDPPSPVSKAAPPPATLGRKAAAAVDEESDALNSGDFTKWNAIQDKKVLAKRGK